MNVHFSRKTSTTHNIMFEQNLDGNEKLIASKKNPCGKYSSEKRADMFTKHLTKLVSLDGFYFLKISLFRRNIPFDRQILACLFLNVYIHVEVEAD